MVKIIGICCLASICVAVGIRKAAKLKKRVEYLEKLILLLRFIISQIQYTAEPFSVIFKKAASMQEFAELSFLLSTDAKEEFQSPFLLMKKRIAEFESTGILHKDDLSLLDNLADAMGALNAEGEIRQLQLYGKLLEERLQNARKEYAEKGKMFRTLGALGGAAVFIILI